MSSLLERHRRRSSSPKSESASLAEQVDRHPLDGGDVDEGVAELGIGEEAVGHDVRIELLVLAEVGLLEALGVDRVDLVELETGLSLEGGEGPDSLSGQGRRSTRNRTRRATPDFISR